MLSDKFHLDQLQERMQKIDLELKKETQLKENRDREESEALLRIQREKDKLKEEIRDFDQRMAQKRRELDQLRNQRPQRRQRGCVIQ